jgi:glycosyltransferase involved in cell wall biosynthesis
MGESLRILFLTDLYRPFTGGASTHQAGLAARLAARGHEVRVLTSRLPGTPRMESSLGVTIERVGSWKAAGRYSIIAPGVLRALGICRSIDVVHGTTFIATAPSSLTGQICNRPTVVTAFEVFDDLWMALYPKQRVKALGHQLAERMILRMPVDKFVAVSEYTRRKLEATGIDCSQSVTIHCGVDYDFWSRIHARPGEFRDRNDLTDRLVYCSYGRAGVSKGIDTLITAAEIVASKLPEARLLLCLNEGEMHDRHLKAVNESLALRGKVVLRSHLNAFDLRDAVAAADMVVVPSISEGFGYSVAEACALGTPVVATSAGAIPEVISGKHLLVPPGNPVALANAIVQGAAGDWSLTPEKRFLWHDAVLRYEQCFRDVSH